MKLRVIMQKRTFFYIVLDIILLNLSVFLAFIIRFEGTREYSANLILFLIYLTLARLIALLGLNVYTIIWKYAGLRDMLRLLTAVTIGSVIFVSAVFFSGRISVPRTILVIDWFLCLSFLMGYRIFPRLRPHLNIFTSIKKGKRTLIIGAGEAGTMVARDMLRKKDSDYAPLCFLDDDCTKTGSTIHGVKVAGTTEEIEKFVRKFKIELIVIALPHAASGVIKKLVDNCATLAGLGVDYKIIPGYKDIIDGVVSITNIREVELEDLLGRDLVTLDTAGISHYIKGKTVLITGAGGSIGSELTRQTLKFNPKMIVLAGQGENSIYGIEMELNNLHPNKNPAKIIPVIADVKEKNKMEYIFRKYSPEVVLHAAAYKHVPLMEHNPEEAVKNNIAGTKNLAELSIKYGVERFVMISTDKAVNPTSIMGATKRAAELVVQALSKSQKKTRFMTVRFGNVLGSRGSVIPLFKKQILAGGPVTVTHPEVVRYFMTIEEAAQLVMQAGSMVTNGDVFVLDMGEPVKIADLARDLIRLSGYTPDVDIKIEYVGLRPGEKLYEEVLTQEEGILASSHKKIFRATPERVNEKRLTADIENLILLAESCDFDRKKAEKLLKKIVPSFKREREYK